jgi:hypothetical protein
MLTEKQAKCLLARASGETLARSAKLAGYECCNDNSASSITSTLLAYLRSNKAFLAALEQAGLGPDALAGKLSTLMDADIQGTPDNRTQIEVCKLLLRIFGAGKPSKHKEVEGDEPTFLEKLTELSDS